jgi:hypothetical protein
VTEHPTATQFVDAITVVYDANIPWDLRFFQSLHRNVPAGAPVTQYCSATVYDRDTHALVRNMQCASQSSQNPEIQKNADGSVDIYFGPKAPTGKESNWGSHRCESEIRGSISALRSRAALVRQNLDAAGHRED